MPRPKSIPKSYTEPKTKMGPEPQTIPEFLGPIEPGDFVRDKRTGQHWHVDAVENGGWSGKLILVCSCRSLLVNFRETIWYLDEVIPAIKKPKTTSYVSNTTKIAKEARANKALEALTNAFATTFASDEAAE